MLDKNSLTQLSQLKASIQADKEYAEGVVAGTSGRFGFVRLDDGRDAFLSPDKMQRVIPGDRVKVSLKTNAKDKLEAELEKLVSSELGRFIGTYRIKNGAHFAVPDQPQINRWLFIPPKGRVKAQDGDLVVAKLASHPFKDGKASAKILDVIGKSDQPKIEHKYITAQFDLSRDWTNAVEQQAQQLQKLSATPDENRKDLQDIPFVTIDGRNTRDMDDALAVESMENGWLLHVAIADPASFIEPGSALANTAQQHGQTLYMPGGPLSMLPQALATEVFSLVEATSRPALVCHISFDKSGAITDYQFEHGVILSRAKLNYTDVAAALNGEQVADITDELRPNLLKLHELAQARLAYRIEHALVNPDQPDFDLILDDQGKIADIVKREKTPAHRLVEEAMLATNICAGQLLAEHDVGLFAAHPGFREDRIGEVRALLKEELPDLDTSAINDLTGHVELIKLLEKSETHSKLLGPLRRMMRGSELSAKAAPHLGLGLSHYATVTSPIRRFADLYNHWAIRHILYKEPMSKIAAADLEALHESLAQGRQANRQLEQWLVCQYLKSNKGMQGTARIRIVTPKGFGARFEHNGIDGFVTFDRKTEKSFDAKRMTLTVGDNTYHINDTVEVKVAGVELEKRRVKFELV
jgi:exoribonuclease-2